MLRRLTPFVLPRVATMAAAGGAATTLPCFRWCTSVKVPFLSDSIKTGKIIAIVRNVGEAVAEDEVICQIETEKQTVDITAPHAGVVTLVPAVGAQVAYNEEVCRVKKGDAPAKAAPAAVAPKAADAPKVDAPIAAPKVVVTAAPAVSEAPRPVAPAGPKVVTGNDSRTRLVPISSMRQRIADRLKASQNTAAMLTTFNEIDMTNLIKMREKYKDEFAKKHNVRLGFMSPFAKASAMALMDVPVINATWGTENITYNDFVDISVAVASKSGLVVPVLRDVHRMSLADIEKTIEDFGRRAKDNKITMAEMSGGTFTISNGGTYGSWMGTPIINPPQSAILGMHAVKKKAWVDEKDQIVVRQIMAVALTYDHRLIDGRDAVTFLVKLKNLIEDPVRLVLDLP